MQRFPEKMRMLRERYGMTQRELAKELGFTGSAHVHYLETGKRKPTAEVVVKLGQIFGVTPDQLLLDDVEVE